MSSLGPLDEQKSIRLRRRLWGAAVFIALLVIFVPLILDGSGSESQYRRVERLREEPPRILSAEGVPEAVVSTPIEPGEPNEQQQLPEDTQSVLTEQTGKVVDGASEKKVVVSPTRQPSQATASLNAEQLSAWVVQAGSFGEEANALAVRDKLRRAGFPSFVTPSDDPTPLYRVRVGPMINLQQAKASRDKVMRLLQREAIVVRYPNE